MSLDGLPSPRRVALGLAALGAIVGLATPTVASAATPTDAQSTTMAAPAKPDAAQLGGYDPALQPNAYYCGPAATRIALSVHGHRPSFDELASALGTTPAGTASIFEVTRVLNSVYGDQRYESVELPRKGATGAQVKKLRADVMNAITAGDAVVANIIGTITDTAGEIHSYNGGHYVTITGYSDGGRTLTVTDPADRIGSNEYQVPLPVMADWISSRGYAA